MNRSDIDRNRCPGCGLNFDGCFRQEVLSVRCLHVCCLTCAMGHAGTNYNPDRGINPIFRCAVFGCTRQTSFDRFGAVLIARGNVGANRKRNCPRPIRNDAVLAHITEALINGANSNSPAEQPGSSLNNTVEADAESPGSTNSNATLASTSPSTIGSIVHKRFKLKPSSISRSTRRSTRLSGNKRRVEELDSHSDGNETVTAPSYQSVLGEQARNNEENDSADSEIAK